MAEITVDESWRQIRALVDRAEQTAGERRWTDAVERLRAVLAHPCAHHQVVAYEVLDEIHQTWRQACRYDDAIAAKREAIEAGYRSVPDPEADIAECLLAAGRREEADALFATLRERDPEDVWLYNAAAYSYADVDMAASLKWALDGIDVALATGDPDQVVIQLLECAEAAWEAPDQPADDALTSSGSSGSARSGPRSPPEAHGVTRHPSRTAPVRTAATNRRPAAPSWTNEPAETVDVYSRLRIPRRWSGSTPLSVRNPGPSCPARSSSPSAGSRPTSGPRRPNAGRTCSRTCPSTTSPTAMRPRHGSSASPGMPPGTGCTSRR